jgi:hypothetical protein
MKKIGISIMNYFECNRKWGDLLKYENIPYEYRIHTKDRLRLELKDARVDDYVTGNWYIHLPFEVSWADKEDISHINRCLSYKFKKSKQFFELSDDIFNPNPKSNNAYRMSMGKYETESCIGGIKVTTVTLETRFNDYMPSSSRAFLDFH